MPIRPLMPVSSRPSQKNCARMVRLVAPTAFINANLARALRDRHQHDVDDAHGAQSQRDNAHATKENIHGVKDCR